MQTSVASIRITLTFAIVDVFALEALTGNPLAVVDGIVHLPIDLYRRIAREFNQVETTFVLPPTQGQADRRLRSFTAAGVEVFGAGHNSMGAWWWLAATGRLAPRTITIAGRCVVTASGSPACPARLAAHIKPQNSCGALPLTERQKSGPGDRRVLLAPERNGRRT